MRRLVVVVWLTTLLVPAAAAAQNQVADAALAYDQGLEAYLAENFDDALQFFKTAEASGQTSGELLYNIGNSYFRLNQLGMAVLYFERARRLMPTDDLLNHSERIARRKTQNRFDRIPRPFYQVWWGAFVARLGTGWMFFVGLTFYLMSVVFLGVRIWTRSRNDWLRRGAILCLLGGLPLLAASFKASTDIASRRSAVVIETQAVLRENPSDVAEAEARVFEGLIVSIIDHSEDWIEVKLPDGTTGWIRANTVEEV